jgi:hypothetical protein
VYFEPLYVTAAPLAYAVQLANAGTPAQLTCADARPDMRHNVPNAKRTETIRRVGLIVPPRAQMSQRCDDTAPTIF